MAHAAFFMVNEIASADIPVAPPGYYVEAYVTGLQNVSGIAFSPGGDFGYEGQLFVLDSRPNGKIYRVPNKDNKILFANGPSRELISLDFAPIGSPFGPNLFLCIGYDIYSLNSSGSATHFADIHAFPWNIKFAPDDRFRNNLFHADGWEPAREAVREWKPDRTHSVLVYTDREETVGLAFGPGDDFGNDLYVLFQKQGRHGYKPATISRVTPEGVMTDWLVFPTEYENTIAFAFDSTSNFGSSLFVSEFTTNKLLEITPNGNISEFASGFSFSSHPDHWHLASRIAFGPDGAMYVSDGGAGVVWRIAPILGELDHIEITGPDEVVENLTAQYQATAYYDGGTVVDVTSWAQWSVVPETVGSIDGSGLLTTDTVHMPQQNVAIHAQYTAGEVTKIAEKEVTIFATCPSGFALQFDGQNDYVNCGVIGITAPATVSMWLKPDNTTGDRRILQFLGSSGGWRGGSLTIINDDIMVTGCDSCISKLVDMSYSWVGEWHHLAVVYNSDGTAVGYFDGVEQLTGISDFDYDSVPMGLGNRYLDRWGNTYAGMMDEVAIYDRALSAEEIRANMHQHLVGNEPNLVAYWSFDKGEGQEAEDLSGNGKDGTLGSSPEPDGSDPAWIDSSAPIGFCTLEGIVERDLSVVLDTKLDIIKQLGQARAAELGVLDMLNTHFKNRNFGTVKKRDIVKAKQKIHTAIQHEVQAETDVYKSIDNLEEALLTLDCEVEEHNQPVGLEADHPIRADLNGDRIIDYQDFLILSEHWLSTYEIE